MGSHSFYTNEQEVFQRSQKETTFDVEAEFGMPGNATDNVVSKSTVTFDNEVRTSVDVSLKISIHVTRILNTTFSSEK